MQNESLLAATASEPLSIDEEYEMQQSWRDDPEKCTFIVLTREKVDGRLLEQLIAADDGSNNEGAGALFFIEATTHAMIGDVNLFLSDDYEDSDSDSSAALNVAQQQPTQKQAEIDIMVADPDYRRQGIGREATVLMMWYCATRLPVGLRRVFCKINESNSGSLALFNGMGFSQCAFAECFRECELELRRNTNDELIKVLVDAIGLPPEVQVLRLC
jgi:RimJ/RimL family protein N-acetyltransferase